jgi:hypothetical protein
MLDDKIRPLANQMPIHPKHWPQRRFHLRGCVGSRLQSSDGQRNQALQHWDVALGGEADEKWRIHTLTLKTGMDSHEEAQKEELAESIFLTQSVCDPAAARVVPSTSFL